MRESRQQSDFEKSFRRNGMVLLAVLFLAVLAGRFSLGVLHPALEGIDLRWVLAGALTLYFVHWVGFFQAHPIYDPPSVQWMFFSLWIGWMMLTSLWSSPSADVAGQVQNFALLFVWVALARGIASRLPAETSRVLFVLALVAGYVYLVGGLLGGAGEGQRLSAFGGGPNVFVRVLVLGALSAVALSVLQSNKWFPFLAVPLLVGAMLSGSRGGVLAAVLVGLAALPGVLKRVGARRLFGSAVVLGAAGLYFWRLLPQSSLDFLHERFVVQTLQGRYTSGRDEITLKALQAFEEHLIAGMGVGSFEAANGAGTPGLHAHNLFLSSAAEGGTVGVALLVLALFVPIWSTLRIRPLAPEAWLLLLSALFILLASLFSGDYYDTRFMWIYLAFAQVWGSRRQGESASLPTRRSGSRSVTSLRA